MSINEKVRDAVHSGLEENNKEIVAADDNYRRAVEFVSKWGEGVKKAEGMDPEVAAAFKAVVEEREAEIRAELEGNGVDVEMVINSHEGVQLWVPARYNNGTAIESALVEHVASVCFGMDPSARTGRFGDYVAISLPGLKRRTGLANAVKKVDGVMDIAGIDIIPTEFYIGSSGEFDDLRSVVIKLTPSAIEYSLIPVHKKNADFFPGYKVPFMLLTEDGGFPVQVTSTTAKNRGNYICSRGDGSLGTLYTDMGLKDGDEIKITEIKPKEKYSLIRA